MAQVAIVMGSNSDLPVVQGAIDQLKSFGVDFEAHVISAHRTPQRAEEFAKSAKENGVKVIIAAAGKAAHLGGVIAAYTTSALAEKLDKFKADMAKAVEEKDKKLQDELLNKA